MTPEREEEIRVGLELGDPCPEEAAYWYGAADALLAALDEMREYYSVLLSKTGRLMLENTKLKAENEKLRRDLSEAVRDLLAALDEARERGETWRDEALAWTKASMEFEAENEKLRRVVNEARTVVCEWAEVLGDMEPLAAALRDLDGEA